MARKSIWTVDIISYPGFRENFSISLQEKERILLAWMNSHLDRLERSRALASFITGMELLNTVSWETGKSLYMSSMPTYLRAKILPSSVPSRGARCAPNREGF